VEGILSQDEVDALLDGGGDGEPTAAASADQGGVRSYDMASQERIVRGRMPTLEIIHERFARNLRIGMFNFMRRTPEVSIGTIRILKYSAFLRESGFPQATTRQLPVYFRADAGVCGDRLPVWRQWQAPCADRRS
jgi:flagellar motor switch protein FliM